MFFESIQEDVKFNPFHRLIEALNFKQIVRRRRRRMNRLFYFLKQMIKYACRYVQANRFFLFFSSSRTVFFQP